MWACVATGSRSCDVWLQICAEEIAMNENVKLRPLSLWRGQMIALVGLGGLAACNPSHTQGLETTGHVREADLSTGGHVFEIDLADMGFACDPFGSSSNITFGTTSLGMVFGASVVNDPAQARDIFLTTSCNSLTATRDEIHVINPRTAVAGNPAGAGVGTFHTSIAPAEGWGALTLIPGGAILACEIDSNVDPTHKARVFKVLPTADVSTWQTSLLFEGDVSAGGVSGGRCDGLAWDNGDKKAGINPSVFTSIDQSTKIFRFNPDGSARDFSLVGGMNA